MTARLETCSPTACTWEYALHKSTACANQAAMLLGLHHLSMRRGTESWMFLRFLMSSLVMSRYHSSPTVAVQDVLPPICPSSYQQRLRLTFVSWPSSGKKAWPCSLPTAGISAMGWAALASEGDPASAARPLGLPRMAPSSWLTTTEERLGPTVLPRRASATCTSIATAPIYGPLATQHCCCTVQAPA